MKFGIRSLATWWLTVSGLALLSLAWSSTAMAATNGTATLSGGTLTYLSDSNRENQVGVSVAGASIVISDPGAQTITDGDGSGGCVVAGATATCPAASTARLVLDTGGGSDSVILAPNVTLAATIRAGNGKDTVRGGTGNDTLDGGQGADEIFGGPGNDTVDYSDRTQKLTVSLDGVADDGQGSENDNVATDVESVVAGSRDDVLSGNAADNTFDGGLGADVISGGGGSDTVTYASRTAPIAADLDGVADDGAAGEGDKLDADLENLIGGSAADVLAGDDEDNLLDGGGGADVLRGGGGSDTVDYSSRQSAVNATPGTGADDGQAGEQDNIAADVEGALGGAGNDNLSGNAGNGRLSGGAGDDRLGTDAGDDAISGGPGNDTVDYSGRSGGIDVSLDDGENDGEGAETDNVAADVETVLGGGGDDNITGSGASNLLVGGNGNDSLSGDDGDDQLIGGPGDDTLQGDDGADTLRGESGLDTFDGGDGPDAVFSRDGVAEQVSCGDGSDGVEADGLDLVDDDCESITGFVAGPAIKVLSTKLKIAQDGSLTVRIKCIRLNGDCEGTLAVDTPATRRKGKVVQPKRLGNGDLFLSSGEEDRVDITLTKAGRNAVRPGKSIRVQVRSSVARTPTVSQAAQLSKAKKKKKTKKRSVRPKRR